MKYRVDDKANEDLVREIEALIRLYDVTELQRLREKIEPKWWESGLHLLLFIAGLGFIITIYKLVPAQSPLLFGFVFGWFLVFILSLLGTIEYLIVKVRALTRLYEWQARLLDHFVKQAMPSRTGTPSEDAKLPPKTN